MGLIMSGVLPGGGRGCDRKARQPRDAKPSKRAASLGGFKIRFPGGLAVSGSGVIGLAVAVVLVVLGALLVPHFFAADVIYTEPIETAGTNGNPFMPPVGTDQRGVTAPAGSGGTFTGATSGLYGGTLNNSSCERQTMIAFLQEHPDKGAAWAEVEGIKQADLASYIFSLTPVLLRSNTLVTNHGFSNGRATTLLSVLQPGTAVLVDKYGVPRARCFCGNPLTPPTRTTASRYRGPTWPGLAPAASTTIKPAATPISQFTLVNPLTGEVFSRPVGTSGERDWPQMPRQPTLPPSTSETPPPLPPETTETTPPLVPETPPDTVPSGFIGTWTGSVTQDDYERSPYPTTVQITGGSIGQTVATGRYPTLDCQVHWTLKQANPQEIVVHETVDQGPECVNVDITLTLLSDATMRYIFDSGHGRAILQRVF